MKIEANTLKTKLNYLGLGITNKITTSGVVNVDKAGTYTVKYTVKNSKGKTATATRTIIVKQKEQPKPESTKPADTNPVETKPADSTKPTETEKPASTTPTEDEQKPQNNENDNTSE